MQLKKLTALALALVLLLGMTVTVNASNTWEEPEVEYLVGGTASGTGYTLDIQINVVYAYTGRLALSFDTSKLSLAGPDDLTAFTMASGINAVTEIYPASEMVSSSGGYACLAWYCSGLDALQGPKQIATLRFQFKDGFSAADLDASSILLLPIEKGDKAPFACAASIDGRGHLAPIYYEYLTQERPCGVKLQYEGSDRAPADGYTVTFRCVNNLGTAVDAILEIDAQGYVMEGGQKELTLGKGEYLWRMQSEGYGTQYGRVTVNGAQNVDVTVVSDETLVQQAADNLEIGYQKGDSAKRVSKTLILPVSTDNGVRISWQSSDTSIITNEGFVYPAGTSKEITMTATLTRGNAAQTKTFQLLVAAKGSEDDDPLPTKSKFTDLGRHEWARDAIERLAAAGIIKGTSETTFSPSANIRRGDFVALLVRMLGIGGNNSATAFDDVPDDSYYFKEIAQARTLGIVPSGPWSPGG